jgi:hypothetical protein
MGSLMPLGISGAIYANPNLLKTRKRRVRVDLPSSNMIHACPAPLFSTREAGRCIRLAP